MIEVIKLLKDHLGSEILEVIDCFDDVPEECHEDVLIFLKEEFKSHRIVEVLREIDSIKAFPSWHECLDHLFDLESIANNGFFNESKIKEDLLDSEGVFESKSGLIILIS